MKPTPNKIVVKGFTKSGAPRRDRTSVGFGDDVNVSIDVDWIPVEITLTDKDIKAIGDRYLELLTKKRGKKNG